MKVLNRFIKGVAYVAVLVWVFLGLYITALFMTSMFTGLVVGGFSLIIHSVPVIIQEYAGLFIIIIAVPIALIMWLISFIQGRRENKKVLEIIEQNKIK